jgi:hypothetical protein
MKTSGFHEICAFPIASLRSSRLFVHSLLGRRWTGVAIVCCLCWVGAAGTETPAARAVAPAGTAADDHDDEDDGEFARKADILHGPAWQRAIAELGGWLATQTVYSPVQVRRIKLQFNDRVAAMSSYELEYLLDSIAVKLRLLDTPEARDAKAWLGEYLAAMSDARRARELRDVPTIIDMSAADLRREIQRIDALRGTLRQRQQGVESRQAALVGRAAAGREASAAASRAAAANRRSAPSHSPYRSAGGSPPFSDVQRRRPSIMVGPFGAGVMF